MKKSKLDLGKGFKRIYFTLAGLWLILPLYYVFSGSVNKDDVFGFTWTDIFQMIALPFVIYFILLFFIKGFKKTD
ncbi:hypothetical protein [Candidatus Pelagibacter sp. HIMB1611]|uniref:hypothetical protein n=1 Tax=Candidatus Pelagibacter sp. HIMB1611 TaxID=3413357 RepID=UPI003F8568DE